MRRPPKAIPGQPVSAAQFNEWNEYHERRGTIKGSSPIQVHDAAGCQVISLAVHRERWRGYVTSEIAMSGSTPSPGEVQRVYGFGSAEEDYGEPVTVQPWCMADDTSIAVGLMVTIESEGKDWFVTEAECEAAE